MPTTPQQSLINKPLKKCLDCGLEAWSEENLNLFRTHKRLSLNKQNLCLTCYSKRYSPEGFERELKRKQLLKSGYKTCRKCKKILSLEEFNNMKDGAGGKGTICKSCAVKSVLEWRANNLQRSRKNNRKSTKKYNQINRRKALIYISGDPPQCNHCGFSDARALQIDHIKGNGASERKIKKLITDRLCKHILTLEKQEVIENYQVLCANCNWIKRVEERSQGGG